MDDFAVVVVVLFVVVPLVGVILAAIVAGCVSCCDPGDSASEDADSQLPFVIHPGATDDEIQSAVISSAFRGHGMVVAVRQPDGSVLVQSAAMKGD